MESNCFCNQRHLTSRNMFVSVQEQPSLRISVRTPNVLLQTRSNTQGCRSSVIKGQRCADVDFEWAQGPIIQRNTKSDVAFLFASPLQRAFMFSCACNYVAFPTQLTFSASDNRSVPVEVHCCDTSRGPSDWLAQLSTCIQRAWVQTLSGT